MLLAIDIGNTNIVIGGIRNGQIVFEARIATDPIKTSDQYAAEINSILTLFHADLEEFGDAIISSVVPPVFNSVRTGIMKLTHREPMVVGPGIKTGLNIQMDDPASVGSDLIVAAVAAIQEYEPPLILIDMGTATTVCAIGRGNTYLGGVVIPGVRVSAESLTNNTALLPGIQLDRPKQAICKNTVDAIRAGVMFSAADALDGMIRRFEAELGEPATVIATGGISQFVVPLCQRKIIQEKDLLLKGMDYLYHKNRKR